MNERAKQLEGLTTILLGFKTLKAEVGEIKACLEWITEKFGDVVSVSQFLHETAPSLLLTPIGIPNPKILFVGHIDVVAAEETQFTPRTEGDRLYGRGSFDMKGPLVAALLVFQNAIKNSTEENMPSVGVLITSDEEVGGKDGVGRILSENLLRPEIAIVPDGGNAFEFAEGGKGVGWLDITVRGKAGHVSRPWEGKNAIQLMAKALTALEEKYPGMQEIRTDETTLSPISISTENTSSNVIPNQAFASFNLRFTDDFDFEELKKTVEQFEGVSEAVITKSTEPYQANLAHPLSQKFLEIVKSELGTPIKTSVYPSTCDARFFAQLGIPVIVTRPEGDGAHGPDEWVSLKSLAQFQEVLERFISKYA